MRFLPNPHYEAELRDLTGLDDAGASSTSSARTASTSSTTRLTPLLDYLLPAYEQEGKSHLTVGIGCTGGRHRSVVIAEHLARVYAERGDLLVDVVHRGHREAAAPALTGGAPKRRAPIDSGTARTKRRKEHRWP